MTATPETTRRPWPDTDTQRLETSKLFRQVLAARRSVETTTTAATVAYQDAEAARTRLGQLEAEYAAKTRGCAQ